MSINSITQAGYSAYAASTTITKDKNTVTKESVAVSVSVSKTTVSADKFLPSEKSDGMEGIIGYWPKQVTSANFSSLTGLWDAMLGYSERNVSGQFKQANYASMSFEELAASIGMGITPETAAAAISEDGAWGVNAVSTRLMDMAISLSGGDPAMAEELREAVQKGFEAVGDISSLPQVCQDTYAETMKRFDAWIADDTAAEGTQQGAEVEQAEDSSSAATRPYADYDDPADYNDDGNVDPDEFITYAKDMLARIKAGTWVDDGRAAAMRAKNMPIAPKRMEGETDENFQLRQINYELSYSWKTNLNSWLDHIEGWRMGESQRYLDEKSTAWVTDLMETKPAHFRRWLETHVQDDVNAGRYDKNGNFTVATVPKGFTVSDYNEWMSKGVLEYL